MTPTAAQPSCAPATRSYSRADIVTLGQAGRPWEFLGVAARALDIAPEDAGIRFLVAANLARLALPTLALAQVERLPAEVRSDAAVRALERTLRAAPTDAVTPATLRQTLAANVDALSRRADGPVLDASSWLRGLDAWTVCRAVGGSLVRVPAPDAPLSTWVGLSDARGAAAKAVSQLPTAADGFPPPVVVDGADPPWALLECVRSRPPTASGYEPPVTVVEESIDSFLWACASADLREAITQARVRFYVGPGATARLERDLCARTAFQITGFCIPARSGVSTALRGALERVCAAQERAIAALARRVDDLYASRDRAWWARRYAAPDRPLRVLIPTCRYSTFVRHASADLAGAFRAAGHDAEVLIEPDASTRFSRGAYLERVAEFEPDLVVLINYTRSNLDGRTGTSVIPAGVPFVCWIQDAMPHLFDAGVGASQTELDFVVGHTYPELFERFGYPRERAVRCGAAADPAKFAHTFSSAPDARMECEVAYVSNHSEPLDVLRARLRSPFAGTPLATAVDALAELVEAEVSRPPGAREFVPYDGLARRALCACAPGPVLDEPVSLLARQFAEPYADRLVRHQTLAWAAEICERRRWRFRLYGRGWGEHPTLARYASGELAHGAELGAAYASAAAQLQVSAHSLVHQRLFECLASGGFPLCRLHQGEFDQVYWWMLHEITATTLPRAGSEWPRSARCLACFADAPGLMRWASLMQRLGLFESTFTEVSGTRCGVLLRERLFEEGYRYPRSRPELDCALWHLGEHAEHFFHSPQTLEERLECAIERPALRRALVESASRRARAVRAYDSVVRSILGLVRPSLQPPGPAPDRP